MLDCTPAKSREIKDIKSIENGVLLCAEAGACSILFYSESIIRIRYTRKDSFSDRIKDGIVGKPCAIPFDVKKDEKNIVISTPKLKVAVDMVTGSFKYFDGEGNLYLAERDRNSKTLEEFQSYVPYKGEQAKTEIVKTADGEKELVREVAKVPGEKFYHTRLNLCFQEDEALYGLGQQEENILNLRGQVVYVHQANRKIAMPMLVSSKKYGLLINTYSPMIFNDNVNGSYLYTEADDEMDFFFIAGQTMMDVNRGYRFLTGKAVMLPKWAFGYIQSQERYENENEIISVAKEHRDRGIGLDCIVLDWLSWPDGMWGQKSFDPVRFSDPTAMMKALHDMDVHFMISIWPNMSKGTPNNEEMSKEDGLLFASDLYNPLDPHAREVYWNQVNSKLFCHGVDAWWCDSSEPITVEWVHQERMEPAGLYYEYCRELQNRLPVWAMNAFPFYHAQTLYEGQRGVTEEKRVCNLTRSAYTGQQRFGTILWSGDTAATWDTLRSQIASGLGFVSSGLPYWTVDIGAFFVKPGNYWYWDGDYADTNKDGGYLELYTRWYQWAAFLPVFRGHGTDVRRELWNFKGKDDLFYNAMLKVNKLRYQLMPYIYSQAGKVWLEDSMMVRPLVYDFEDDGDVINIKDQYMFGDSMMVCPVTEAMYYEAGDVALKDKKKTRFVYLPKGSGFYDFWTNEYYEGGQRVEVAADIDRIPVFVKEGSIIPMAPGEDRVCKLSPADERDTLSFRVYAGKDTEYLLYQDAGDGYGYEKGEYDLTTYSWSEDKQILTAYGVPVERVEIIGK